MGKFRAGTLLAMLLLSSFAFSEDTHAPTCEEQYQTWAMMVSFRNVCALSQDQKDFMDIYAQGAKHACGNSLTPKWRDYITKKIILKTKAQYNEYGEAVFCQAADKIINNLMLNN